MLASNSPFINIVNSKICIWKDKILIKLSITASTDDIVRIGVFFSSHKHQLLGFVDNVDFETRTELHPVQWDVADIIGVLDGGGGVVWNIFEDKFK